MKNWVARQFLDWWVRHPGRFVFRDIQGNVAEFTRELFFTPGRVERVGTPLNRGYFQRLEEGLKQHDSQGVWMALRKLAERAWKRLADANGALRQMTAETEKKVSGPEGLSVRIGKAEQDCMLYVPKTGAVFVNPKSEVSPPATDASTMLATTAGVRAFVGQYAFPPKNVPWMEARPGSKRVELRWSDPADPTYDGMSLATWRGTKAVYRADRYPASETDGTVLEDNTLRDYRKSMGVTVENLAVGTLAFFALFPYTDKGVYNRSASNRTVAVVGGKQAMPNLSAGRAWLAAATDGRGSVLFAGGFRSYQGSQAAVDRYETNGNHTVLEGLSVAREKLAAAADGNGNVLFAGGTVELIGMGTTAVDKYDIYGNHSVLQGLSQNKRAMAGATDGNGNVLFGGGVNNGQDYGVERYDKSGVRTLLTPLMQGRVALAAATDKNGSVLFGGGQGGNSGVGAGNLVERYDKNGSRTSLPPLADFVAKLAAATDGNGSVLFAGGEKIYWSNTYSDTVEKYDVNGVKTTLPKLSGQRESLSAAADGFGNVLFGGGRKNSSIYSTAEKYDKNGVRTTLENLSNYKADLAAATDGEGNVLFGGGSFDGALATVDKYWRTM